MPKYIKPIYQLFGPFFFLVMLLLPMESKANEIVTNNNDAGPGSLREAIANVANGDTVFIETVGTLNLQSQIIVNKSVSIIGPAPIHYRIDYSAITSSGTGALASTTGTHNILIEGIAFLNGTVAHAINIGSGFSGSLDVKGCLFENNNNTPIKLDAGNNTIDACSFIGNISPNEAGAIRTESSIIVRNSTFHNNDCNTIGGAIYVAAAAGNSEIIHCTFFENGTVNCAGGLAIQNESTSLLRLTNNIIFNDTQSDLLIDGGGVFSSSGGNVTNDLVTPNMPFGTDIVNTTVNVGFATGDMITDGWGLKYFSPQAGASGIDIDTNPDNNLLFDQRRVWRVMDGGSFNEFSDAGAIERSQLTVTQSGLSAGSLDDLYNTIYNSATIGKQAFVFEIDGAGPYDCPLGFAPLNLFTDSTIINGYTQQGSMIPGPINAGAKTPGITPISLNKGFGNSYAGIEFLTEGCIVAGLSINSFIGANNNAGIISGLGAGKNTVVGCHIGVDVSGNTFQDNQNGIRVEDGEVYIGKSNYCGKGYDANRNVISGNINAQVRVSGNGKAILTGNFIGIGANGVNRPVGAPQTSDSGVVAVGSNANMLLLGNSDHRRYNLICDQSIGLYISAQQNTVINNLFGTDYTANAKSTETDNNISIEVSGSQGSNNNIGTPGNGNIITASAFGIGLTNGASGNSVISNHIGIGADGTTGLNITNTAITLTNNANDNIIGIAGNGNLIGNASDGIVIENSSNHAIIRGNLIGFQSDTVSSSNINTNGILVASMASFNMIGGCLPGQGNYIGHTIDGISFEGAGADNDTVFGNFIGVDVNGNGSGNSNSGVKFSQFIDNIQIGSTAPGCGNHIAYNATGILSETGGGPNSNLRFLSNRIHDNVGLGIDLNGDGAPNYTTLDGLNDNGDPEIGTVISAINCSGTSVSVRLVTENSATVTYQFFKADASGAEGDSLIFSMPGVTSIDQQDTVLVVPVNIPVGTQMVMTATVDGTRTSEFGPNFTVAGPPAAPSTPSISASTICEFPAITPSLTGTVTGDALWFSDAAQTNQIGSDNTIDVPFADANAAGVYQYYLADSVAGCVSPSSAPVVLTVVTAPVYTITGPDTLCTGSVDPAVYSIRRPNTFNLIGWNWTPEGPPNTSVYNNFTYTTPSVGSEESLSISGATAFTSGSNDTITVEIDSAGCFSYAFKVIVPISAPQPDSDSLSHPTSCGATDGYFGNGGLPPGTDYTYYYNSGLSASVTSDANGYVFVTGLAAGTYTPDSISNGICSEPLFGTFTLTDPNAPIIDTVELVQPATCGGNGTMTIRLTAPLLIATSVDIEYDASNPGPEFSSLLGIGVDNFTVNTSLVDGFTISSIDISAFGCSNTFNAAPLPLTVQDPADPVVSAGPDQTICEGDVATLSGTPVGGAFTFLWENSIGTNLGATNTVNTSPTVTEQFKFFATDNVTMCTGVDSMIVNVNPLPVLSLVSPANICEGNTITYDLTVTGAPVVTYDWQDDADFVNNSVEDAVTLVLAPGTYNHTIVVTDVNGCTNSANETFDVFASPNVSAVATDITCFGANDGTIILTGNGGTAPYQFTNNGGTSYQASASFTGLSSGAYTANMQDANGCVANDTTLNIAEPTQVSFVTTIAEDTCERNVGSITVVATGGITPYQYSSDNGATFGVSNVFSNLSPASYNMVVTDANGCVTAPSVATINTLPGVVAALNSGTPQVSCFGDSDGQIEITTTSNPFGIASYDWSEASSAFTASTASITGLLPGTYTGVITDNRQCKDSITYTINEPALLQVVLSATDESCQDANDGISDTVSVSGGTTPYSYDWQVVPGLTSLGSTIPLTNLNPGDVRLVVTDANFCIATDTVTINPGEAYTASITGQVIDSCQNNNSFNFIDDNNGPASGTNSVSWTFVNGTTGSSTVPAPNGISFNTSGIHDVYYEVNSVGGCTFRDTMQVQVYAFPTVFAGNDQTVCSGTTVNLAGTPASGAYDFTWTDMITSSQVSTASTHSYNALSTTFFYFNVSDPATGCSGVDSVTINVNNGPIVVATSTDESCNGASNGSVDTVSVTGGTAPYTYNWVTVPGNTSVGNTAQVNGLGSGDYAIILTDANLCTGGDTVTVSGSLGNINQPTINGNDPILFCQDVNGLFGHITATSNTVTFGNFNWYVGSISGTPVTSDSLAVTTSNAQNGYVYVTETVGPCTSNPDSVLVSFANNDLDIDSLILYCPGDVVTIDASGTGDLLWESHPLLSDTNTFPQDITPTQNEVIFVTLDDGACIFRDSVQIMLDDCENIDVSNNAFTPDGDGVNDFFIIDIPILGSSENIVTFINRWGDEIAYFENYDNVNVAWDGTSKTGDPLPKGTYFYTVEIPALNVRTTGWVQIVR